VSDDEHIVSNVRLGPVKSKKWETRLATDAGIAPPLHQPLRLELSNWYWLNIIPTKTPTFSWASDARVYPASSRVCQAVSRNRRSWGSITAASFGGIRKNIGSKNSMPSTKPPALQ